MSIIIYQHIDGCNAPDNAHGNTFGNKTDNGSRTSVGETSDNDKTTDNAIDNANVNISDNETQVITPVKCYQCNDSCSNDALRECPNPGDQCYTALGNYY